ncbi:hypothetical protein M409DRAFT_25340 [Zasmidium cellare ATCC 36951]|uniref:Cell wall protein PhiA n=1 Tax=Zasmidium cellare ATCC 36951 TaxID=1080233 RepID=A0A6A6CCI0_ZASCE|nr:uncharacterized protein M409DRAFT_25340 [Zasmidium cellare ATCC 36951]KAF2164463.1 hypothetical protein M409DRAFT_25340 [Zasmidium cellare ATCC 36951]
MLLQTLLALTPLALASAIPQAPNTAIPTFGDRFGITATGPGITNIDLRAQAGRLYIGGPQTPHCENAARQDFATFVRYSDKTLYLFKYGPPPQQVWVDASGMGQGITGYANVDGNSTAPRNASWGAWEVDEGTGEVSFEGVGAKACPTGEEGRWSLWFSESEMPGWQSGCVDVGLRAYAAPARVACEYTTE